MTGLSGLLEEVTGCRKVEDEKTDLSQDVNSFEIFP
jgi:hypothetical protein